jgi:hypothetical protein
MSHQTSVAVSEQTDLAISLSHVSSVRPVHPHRLDAEWQAGVSVKCWLLLH